MLSLPEASNFSGLCGALVSILCFGSLGVFVKSPPIRREGVHPFLVVTLFSAAIAVVGLILLVLLIATGESVRVDMPGLYASLVFAPGNVLLLWAARRVGVGLSGGIVACWAAVVGFFSGLARSATPDSLGFKLLGLALLIVGSLGMTGTKFPFLTAFCHPPTSLPTTVLEDGGEEKVGEGGVEDEEGEPHRPNRPHTHRPHGPSEDAEAQTHSPTHRLKASLGRRGHRDVWSREQSPVIHQKRLGGRTDAHTYNPGDQGNLARDARDLAGQLRRDSGRAIHTDNAGTIMVNPGQVSLLTQSGYGYGPRQARQAPVRTIKGVGFFLPRVEIWSPASQPSEPSVPPEVAAADPRWSSSLNGDPLGYTPDRRGAQKHIHVSAAAALAGGGAYAALPDADPDHTTDPGLTGRGSVDLGQTPVKGPSPSQPLPPAQPPPDRFATTGTTGVDLFGMLVAVLSGAFLGLQGLFWTEPPLSAISTFLLAQCLWTILLLLPFLARNGFEICRLRHIRVAGLSCVVGGLCYTLAFVGQVMAISGLGDMIGLPLTQLNLVVSGVWGLFYFEELGPPKNAALLVTLFFLAVLVALAGGALLCF